MHAPVLLPATIPTRGDPRLTDYTPVFALWSKVVDLNEEASALGYNNVVHFGPGVQLSQEIGGQLRETAITEQVADMMLEERRNSIVESIFVPCKQPLLEEPETSEDKGKAGPSKTARKEPTRRSTRQQVLTNSVPVSKRATHHLIKAFEVVGPAEPVGEQAMEAYIRSYVFSPDRRRPSPKMEKRNSAFL